MPANLETVKNKISELLKHMGFEADVLERQEEGRTVLNIRTADAQLLIGKQGANLEALQHIVHLMARRDAAFEELPFALDIDDYKEKRVIYLKELARKAAHQARTSKRSVALAPMPSYERRVVHNYLSLFSDLISESMGEEPSRRIVIKNKAKEKSSDDFEFIENT